MTTPDDFAPTETPMALPGLADDAPRTASALHLATRRTLADLHAAGRVTEQHAMLCQLMLDLADVVDTGKRNGRASAVAMAAAQILAAYAVLVPETEEGGGDGADAFDELADDLRRAATLSHRA